jgi:hypothetical protein
MVASLFKPQFQRQLATSFKTTIHPTPLLVTGSVTKSGGVRHSNDADKMIVPTEFTFFHRCSWLASLSKKNFDVAICSMLCIPRAEVPLTQTGISGREFPYHFQVP